jgi:uncharacterized protein YuzE
MAEITTMFHDKEGDVLHLTIGAPQEAVSREMGNDVLLHVHSDTGKIVGLTILNFASRFSNLSP